MGKGLDPLKYPMSYYYMFWRITLTPSFHGVSPLNLHAISSKNASLSSSSSSQTPTRNHPLPLPRKNSIFCSLIENDFPELGSWKTRPLYFASNWASATQSFSFVLPLLNLPPMPKNHARWPVPSRPPCQHQSSWVANQNWYPHLKTLHCVPLHPTFPCSHIGFMPVIFSREVMAKDMHRGCLLLRISPPYCIIPTVTFTLWQLITCVLSCKFILPICTFS